MDMWKAFDSVEHAAVIHALTLHGVPQEYATLIQHLYAGQRGSVHGSRSFPILRGVKQGDGWGIRAMEA